MTAVRWAVAWALYLLGDLASRAVSALDRDAPEGAGDDWTPGPAFDAAFAAYQRLMLASDRVQGDGPGPWENPGP